MTRFEDNRRFAERRRARLPMQVREAWRRAANPSIDIGRKQWADAGRALLRHHIEEREAWKLAKSVREGRLPNRSHALKKLRETWVRGDGGESGTPRLTGDSELWAAEIKAYLAQDSCLHLR